jgi:hypothetical protein
VLALQGSRKLVVTAPAEGAASDTALDVAGPATGRAVFCLVMSVDDDK